jgi:septal ring factor EnvC (AmiA/AmiB activator)
MEELDNQRCKLQESMDEVTRLKQLISAKDATIKELQASKKSITQELETARLAAKVAEETSVTLRAQRDRGQGYSGGANLDEETRRGCSRRYKG